MSLPPEQAAPESERLEKLRVEEERQQEEQRREEERQKEERELWEREEKLLALAAEAGQYPCMCPLAACQSFYSCLPFSEFYYYVPSLLVLAAEAGQYPFLVSHVVIYPCC